MQANQISKLRKAKGLSQTDLAEMIGTTLNMLGKLERGERDLTSSWLAKIAKALGVKPPELLAGADVGVTPATVDASASETVPLARLDLSVAMGPGTNIDDHYEVDTVEFDLGWLRSLTRSEPSMLRLVSGSGDSMHPTIHDRDDLIIDTSQRVLNMQDRIWAISLFGAGALKRLRTIGKGKVLVISDNPDIPDQEVAADDISIAGRLVGSFRRH